jgi:hypothetical protein
MKGKYLRYDMIGAINSFCIKNDLHITYVEKLKKSELEAIIIQYDINVDELLAEAAEKHNQVEISLQESKEKIKKTIGFLVGKMEMLESLLNDEQKEKYEEYCNSQTSN